MHMLGEETQTLSSTSSGPSSPRRSEVPSYFFSAPPSPTHFLLYSSPANSGVCSSIRIAPDPDSNPDPEQADFEFTLASRLMSTAEELFFNGQIRPGFVSLDQASNHRRTRSVSPMRTPHMHMLIGEESKEFKPKLKSEAGSIIINSNMIPELIGKSDTTCASTSRSSSSNSSSCNSSNASSRRWGFIKDLLTLQRSKSLATTGAGVASRPVQRQENKNMNNKRGLSKEKTPRRRTTFLPYKQQGFLFGCMGFRSRGFIGNFGIPTVSSRQRRRAEPESN